MLDAEVARAPGRVAARARAWSRGAASRGSERVRSGGGLPLTLEDSWLPEALFPGLTRAATSAARSTR